MRLTAAEHIHRIRDRRRGTDVDTAQRKTLEGLEKNYRVEATSSPSGVTHVTFMR